MKKNKDKKIKEFIEQNIDELRKGYCELHYEDFGVYCEQEYMGVIKE